MQSSKALHYLLVVAFEYCGHSDLAQLVLQPPKEACQDLVWFPIREKLRSEFLGEKLSRWNEVGLNAWGEDFCEATDSPARCERKRNCEAAVMAHRLFVASFRLKVAVELDMVDGWFSQHSELLSEKLSWRIILEPFPLAAILSTIHRQLLPMLADHVPCTPSLGWQDSLNKAMLRASAVGVDGYRSILSPEMTSMANNFLEVITNCRLAGSLAYGILVAGNRTVRPWTSTLVDRIDVGVSWAEALSSSWPIFHVLRAIESRWFFNVCPFNSRAIWSTTNPAFMICVPTEPGWVSGAMMKRGRWGDCDDVVKTLPQASFACDLVVEVGASFGVCTLLFAKLGFRVVAIEAQRRHVKLLRASVALNGLGRRITVVHAAVADTAGKGHMLIPQHNKESTMARLVFGSPHSQQGGNAEVVRVRTVDDIMHGRGKVCAMKTDCEGADILALLGASSVLKAANLIYFEVNIKLTKAVAPQANWTAMHYYLGEHGFEVRTGDSDSVAVRRRPSP